MISIEIKVPVYEVDGKESADMLVVSVQSHWNSLEKVYLRMPGEEKFYTVNADDLIKAIQNAVNR